MTNSVHQYWSTRLADSTQLDYDQIFNFMLRQPVGVLEERVKEYPSDTLGHIVARDILDSVPYRTISTFNS